MHPLYDSVPTKDNDDNGRGDATTSSSPFEQEEKEEDDIRDDVSDVVVLRRRHQSSSESRYDSVPLSEPFEEEEEEEGRLEPLEIEDGGIDNNERDYNDDEFRRPSSSHRRQVPLLLFDPTECRDCSLLLVTVLAVLYLFLYGLGNKPAPPPRKCWSDWDCRDGFSCAYTGPDREVPRRCCPEQRSVDIDFGSGFISYMEKVCGGKAAGDTCGSYNQICASGLCIDEVCSDKKSGENEICDDDKDCEDRICGYPSSNRSGHQVCCSNARFVQYDVDSREYHSDWVKFCRDAPIGTMCGTYNDICTSNLCINGTCAEAPLAENQPCGEDSHCLNRACGYPSYDRSGGKICCPNARSIPKYIDSEPDGKRWQYFCRDAPLGTRCGNYNTICASGLCINGSCTDSLLDDNEPCEEGLDCENGTCGYTSSNPTGNKVCCRNGRGVEIDADLRNYYHNWVIVCEDAPAGTTCGVHNTICASGACINGTCSDELLEDNEICEERQDCKNGACGHLSSNQTGYKVCCPNGRALDFDIDNGNFNIERLSFCLDAPVGTACGGHNEICASGSCRNGICVDQQLEDNEVCKKSIDCKNGACGFASYDQQDNKICCSNGRGIHVGIIDHGYFCRDAPVGTSCGVFNEICASNLCVNGTCSNQLLDDFEVCRERLDCKNGACGIASFDRQWEKICCANGRWVEIDVSTRDYYHDWKYFCRDAPVGTVCRSHNEICASGSCVNGTCSNELLNDFEICEERTDCKNGACGFASFDQEGGKICCANGRGVQIDVSTMDYHHDWKYFCRDAPDGSACGTHNEICANSSCVNGTCSDTLLDDGKSCKGSFECKTKTCGYPSFNRSGTKECCSSGRAVQIDVDSRDYVNDFEYFCRDAPDGTICGGHNEICASRLCINDHCAEKDERLPDNSTCSKDGDCLGGACAYPSIEHSGDKVCCANGESFPGEDHSKGWKEWVHFCKGIAPTGSSCGSYNELCASGLCIGGVCVVEALKDNETCSSNEECLNQACGYRTVDRNSAKFCCRNGNSFQVDLGTEWHPDLAHFCQRAAPTGTWCKVYDELCASGLCISGVCVVEALKDNETCSSNEECLNQACGYRTIDRNSAKFCCRNGDSFQVNFGTELYPDLAHFCQRAAPTGTWCKVYDELCESVKCVDGLCE